MSMSNRSWNRWKIFLWLSVGFAVVSALFGASIGTEGPLRGMTTGIASSLFIATPILLLEVMGRRLPVVRRLQRLPIVLYFAIRVVFYMIVIVGGLLAARALVTGHASFEEIVGDGGFTFSIVMSVLANAIFTIGSLLGFRMVVRLLTGRYVRPRRELRAFLLIDMKNSTGVAERLGAVRFHELLNDFFRDIAEAALECGAEIHKYVGDEAILTWPADQPTLEDDVLACPFVLRDYIAANSTRYLRRFGVVPEFRAGMHCGEIVAGQIGDVRAELAYVGDTLNVAARLLEATKKVGRDVLVSGDLLTRTTLPPGVVAEPLPTLSVRGREAALGIAALSRA
ncbi:adenylate/guanylate cyclase domain-containing protein [Reyranella soli]|uniref:Adenylate cyclase 2 n=1 Tax=Reyranella soli TaxID=1230389 RepID=A0A512NID7_9HYPH|nr:adenylate/guanylate cyclase domain-containing protein [Reyranella soli]GEP58723.1 adenylate cyclase 2 [Reyranella soli]